MAGITNKMKALLALRRIRRSAGDFSWLTSSSRAESNDKFITDQVFKIVSSVEALKEAINKGRLRWDSKK